MARQIRSRMGWDERNGNKIAHKTGLLGIVRNILGLNLRVDGSVSCIVYGRIEDSEVRNTLTAVKGAEVWLRRVQMLQ